MEHLKTALEYLNECQQMAAHNQLCYSANYAMSIPKAGYEKEFAEAVRDGEIVDELITMIKEKETPAEQTPPCECPIMKKVQPLLKLFKELEDYVNANSESSEDANSVEKSDEHRYQSLGLNQAPSSDSMPMRPGELERFYQRVVRQYQEAMRNRDLRQRLEVRQPNAQK